MPMQPNISGFNVIAAASQLAAMAFAYNQQAEAKKTDASRAGVRPNILMVVLDDQSYPYTSAYGCGCVSTPGFDFVANHGAMFTNAYVTSPGSSPSRASILTGLYPWQIEEAGTHASSFPSRYICYPDMFKAEGYAVGFTGKGWGPGDWKASGRPYNPAGPDFNEILLDPPTKGICPIDYASNFADFLDHKEDGVPFCFWIGTKEPHRAYEKDSWIAAGLDTASAYVPGFLPDVPEVRGDVMDYVLEIQWADKHLCTVLDELRSRGMLDNTVIVVTADNGMSFPHSKATCYDAGLHVPLAMCWPGHIPEGTVVVEEVTTVDLLPTFLEAAGISFDPGYRFSGKSLLGRLSGKRKFADDAPLFAGRERHASARAGNLGYPIRSVRVGNWLLVRNFHPERYPAGDPVHYDKNNDKLVDGYEDIDSSPSKKFLIAHRDDTLMKLYFDKAMGFRPEYELFNLEEDPDCFSNLASAPDCAKVLRKMRKKLDRKLRRDGDSRYGKNPEIWESYPKLEGRIRLFPGEK